MQPGLIVLPAHTVTAFHPVDVFAERIGERRVVYLDHNIWIDLRDARTEPARRCYEACLRAVGDQRAVFAVSYAAVSELLEIESFELRLKQADVMDALCRGLTFRIAEVVHRLEAEDLFQYLFFDTPPRERRREAFTMLTDYAGDRRLTFPEGLRPDQVETFLRAYHNENPAFRLRWMVEHLDHAETIRNHARVETYGQRIDARRVAHREHLGVNRIDWELLAHEERTYYYNTFVAPLVRDIANVIGVERIRGRLREVQGADGRRLLRRSFRAAAPSMETLVQLFSRQARDVRRVTERQDFWDAEHAGLAASYADAFVTADGGLNEVLRLGDRRPPTARAVLLRSLDALTTWLDEPTAVED